VLFLNECHKVIVISDALIGTSGYPVLQARCCLSRWRSNRVRPYTKRLKLQTNEEYTVNYRSISQTQCQSDRKYVWRYITPKYSTLEHTKYLIYMLHSKCMETYQEWSFFGFCTLQEWAVLTFGMNVLSSYIGWQNMEWVCEEFGTKFVLAILKFWSMCGQSNCGNL